ncbi:MAG TPA: hypothetical protein VHN15_05120 [Thermoanaerobaculia bacterium]|nr:hypothetical protein [Thermoanaerobaculia bacterium]
MSQRSSQSPVVTVVATLALTLSLGLLPAEAHAADTTRARVRLPQTSESRFLERLERFRAALWQDVMSLWGKAGARIDDNGKS